MLEFWLALTMLCWAFPEETERLSWDGGNSGRMLDVGKLLFVLSGRNDAVLELEVEGGSDVVLVEGAPLPEHFVVVEPASLLPRKRPHT